uniref:Peptidase M20 dimerisation domain-containing protein n=1 Tax=Panagrolaimus sp. ES5 TaxID=591445 RepID=A0AC34FBQ1_9BILA
MNRLRFPSLSIHDSEGAFSDLEAITGIPSKICVKFSIRLVPDMEPKSVDKMVVALHSARPWVADYKHPHYQAAAAAIKIVYGTEPDFIREGESVPVTALLDNLTQTNVMLLPIGACDDMVHSQNEKINVSNYVEGTKVLATYLMELGKL